MSQRLKTGEYFVSGNLSLRYRFLIIRFFCCYPRLKDNSLALVKIADFGLSDFYRPGALIKSSCGTLSFLAPEVFRGTANAGPPLDVWSLGVILFALLCGRLPFEGSDLVGTKRPRDAVIKARIMKCQYKIDDTLGPEAKVSFFESTIVFPCLMLHV